MEKLPHFVSIALTPEEVEQRFPGMPEPDAPVYPYGTQVDLDECVLEKLGVDHSDWEVGDTFHLFALAKIVGINESETEAGCKKRVTLQIEALSGEDEDSENEEADRKMPKPYR